jgi:hypothetical protein
MALDGRIYAMLSEGEREVLDFYRKQGRKYRVAVSIISKADPTELALARSEAQADEIMRRANSIVSVTKSSSQSHLISKPGCGKTTEVNWPLTD